MSEPELELKTQSLPGLSFEARSCGNNAQQMTDVAKMPLQPMVSNLSSMAPAIVAPAKQNFAKQNKRRREEEELTTVMKKKTGTVKMPLQPIVSSLSSMAPAVAAPAK